MPHKTLTPLAAVLFDLDGTLLDTSLDFHTAINQLLVAEGQPEIKPNDIRHYVTNGSQGVVCAAFNIDSDAPEFPRLQQNLLDNYQACLTEKTRLFEGLEASLQLLDAKQIPWGIVTNKPLKYAKPIVDKILPNCAVLICPDHVENAKPDPEGLLLAASKLNAIPQNCLYVGDHRRDIDAGRAAGMDTIAVSWGYIDQATDNPADWGATYLVTTADQLILLISNNLD